MRNGILFALTVCLVAVAPVAAQPVPPPPPFPPQPMPADPVYMMPAPMPAPIVLRPVDPEAYSIWVRAELLVWWVKNAPMPISVTASNDLVNNPNGTPLNISNDYGTFAGFRFAFGGWLDTNNTVGLEVGFFTTEERTHRFFAGSDDGGSPMLAFPFTSTTPGNLGDFILPISVPGQFAGSIRIDQSLSLWGTELNGVFCIARTASLDFTLLAGFRYLDLQENLSIRSSSQSLIDDTLTTFRDHFDTRNQFYGGQVGARVGWRSQRFSLDLTGKLALGGTHEVVDVNGVTVQFPGSSNTPNVYPGGFFAQPSNSGRTTGTQFSIVPAVELKVGYMLTPYCKLFAGYDFLYWNQVVRPGSQVDRNLNLSQSAILGNGVLSGPVSPSPLLNRTDFWAQGITLGVEFRY